VTKFPSLDKKNPSGTRPDGQVQSRGDLEGPLRGGSRLWLVLFFFCGIGVTFTPSARADIAEKIAKLPARSYCINASFPITWETMLFVLSEMEVPTTLTDESGGVVTTEFIAAEPSRIRQISKNARPFKKGRFTLKIELEEIETAFTKAHMTLQIRQEKIIGKKEKILKSRGTFEKFLAFRINQLAIAEQFPSLYEYRLGFDLVPDLSRQQYKVVNVEDRSPAGEAGFKDGDWLIAIDGTPITIKGELFDHLLTDDFEKLLQFRMLRKKREVEIPLWVIRVEESGEKMGMQLVWDEKTRKFWVSAVVPDSRAKQAGVQKGDVLVKENDLMLNSWTNFYRALAREKKGRPTSFEIGRDGQILKVSI